jgi:hypothetical protein
MCWARYIETTPDPIPIESGLITVGYWFHGLYFRLHDHGSGLHGHREGAFYLEKFQEILGGSKRILGVVFM